MSKRGSRGTSCIAAIYFVVLAAGAVSSPACAQTNEWTWMGGSETLPTSCPALADGYLCGNAGIYGTEGQPASTNAPGGRTNGVVWTDAEGNLWLFGGFGTDSAGTVGDLNDLWEFNPSSREWVWQGGPTTIPTKCPANTIGPFCGNSGTYGTLGVFSAGNLPGGRDSAVNWRDSAGNLWLFGGEGYDSSGNYSFLNDLWEFNPNLNQWAWMGGASSNGNNCKPWVAAGVTVCLQPSTPAEPGGRSSSLAWTDREGEFWLYSGLEIDAAGNFGSLDDLWEFDPQTTEWTRIGGATVGSSDGAVLPAYGVPGKPQAGETPGGRTAAAAWADNSGNLWLFGGNSPFLPSPGPLFNDVWEFSPQVGQWAWMGGAQGANYGLDGSGPVYGELGIPAVTNTPGGRTNEVSWTDAEGNFWLSGGFGQGDGNEGGLNDLWVFSPSGNEWTWMGGSSNTYTPQTAPPGVYGTLGVPAPGNLPGAREAAMGWTDEKGNFWTFGGEGVDSSDNFGYLNDLWEYAPPAAPAPVPGFMFYQQEPVDPITYPTGSVGYTFYIFTGGGFDSPIALSASGLPSGSTATFNPNPMNGDGILQLEVAVGANSNDGDYAVAVTGTGGGMTQTTTAGMVVQPPYFVDPAATTLDVQSGTQGTMPVTVSMEAGFNSPVTLSAGGQPNGVSISFAPASITAGESSMMTVSVPTGVATGTYPPITITGTSNGVTEQSQFSLDVTNGPPPTFTVAASPTSLTVPAGSQAAATLTFTPQNGFNGVVTLTCSCAAIPSQSSYALASIVTVSGSPVTTPFTVFNFTSSAAVRRDGHPFLAGTSLALAVCFFGWRRRRKLWTALLVSFVVGSLSLISSCGGGAGSSGGGGSSGGAGGGGSNPVPFNVTVTATSGSIQQATTISVTLN